MWHRPRLANHVWTWSWGLCGIKPAISSVWFRDEFLKFKNQLIKRIVGQKRWLRQRSVQVHRLPCSLPLVNGHYGRLHRSTETNRKKRLIWIYLPRTLVLLFRNMGISGSKLSLYMKRQDDIPDFPLPLLVNRDVDSTCCFPPRTLQFYNCCYLDC